MSTDADTAAGGGRLGYEEGALARYWTAAVGSLATVLVVGSIAFPRQVYAGFVWHYFWGPVYADAKSAACAVWAGGAQQLYYGSCGARSGIVAYPGYTTVSEVGYMVVLLLALVGVVLLLRHFAVGTDRAFFYALLPFTFFGGALRVVEDANDAVPAGADAAITYPWNTLLISPIIYITVFALTLAALFVALWLARAAYVERYHHALFAGGLALLTLSLCYLVWLALGTGYVDFHPLVTVLTLGIATAGTAATWWLVRAFAPSVQSGTGYIGAVVIWGHAIDGAANVLILDWAEALGLAIRYNPKHPVNQAVVALSKTLLPQSLWTVTGTAWPFFLVKLAAATGAVWLFNDEIMEESPRYSILMLVAILAVGLGPGTRDMLRATFGI
ncbi:MAG: DUF63 family protein [Halobacteriaceae archaeon]